MALTSDSPPAPPVALFVGSGYDVDRRRIRLADKLVDQVMRRRTWSLHRHVHLVSAFHAARAQHQISSVLAVGCGAGLSELFLATTHPDVQFTLTDYDESRLDTPRRTASDFGLDNVSFRVIDLLGDPPPERYDLIAGIEVLEHIQQDHLAMRNLLAMADGLVYQLVPHCRERDLVDEALIARVWQQCEHYRPGYSDRTIGDLFADTEVLWARRCYHQPRAAELRAQLKAATDDDLVQRRDHWVEQARLDVGGGPADATGAAGIEVLARVGRPRPPTAGVAAAPAARPLDSRMRVLARKVRRRASNLRP